MQSKSGQGDGGKMSGKLGLLRLSHPRGPLQADSNSTLSQGQEQHHDEGGKRHSDAEQAPLGGPVLNERAES